MRLVFLQSAIQNPKSRIQNHVSALRRSSLGHGHGQAIGAPMHGSAPWKTEETIVGWPRLLRSDSPDLVAATNGTRIRINVLRINDLRSTLTSIRFIELYIHNIEYASETQGFPSSEIEIML